MRVKRLGVAPPGRAMLTPQQAAFELQISRGTLDALLDRGRSGDPLGLRSVRLAPQTVRVPRVELERFIDAHLALSMTESTG